MEDDIENNLRVKTCVVDKGIKHRTVYIPPANLYTLGQASSSSATPANEAVTHPDQQIND